MPKESKESLKNLFTGAKRKQMSLVIWEPTHGSTQKANNSIAPIDGMKLHCNYKHNYL